MMLMNVLLISDGINHLILFSEFQHNGMSSINSLR